MRSWTVLVVVVAVTVVAVVVPGLALGQSSPGTSQAQPTPESTATNTTIAIHPRPNGDARFHISTTFTLDNSNESAAFRALGREFEDGNAGFSASTFRRAANESSTVTGRPMNITNVTRNATIVGENTSETDAGKLVLGFTWTNFARTSGNRLVVGDAFNTTNGTWLPGLTANQVLLIEVPRGYIIDSSPVGFSNGTLRFEGPATFEPGTPSVVFERGSFDSQPPNRGGNPDEPGPLESTPLFALGAGVIVLGGVAVLGAYALRRRDGIGESGRAESSPPDESPDDEPSTTPDATAGTDTPLEAELLSDEEHVERLLERNDGRMKQASIVSETGWSNAKVSQLLSAMDEEGRINKLRIGRENLISLPDEE